MKLTPSSSLLLATLALSAAAAPTDSNGGLSASDSQTNVHHGVLGDGVDQRRQTNPRPNSNTPAANASGGQAMVDTPIQIIPPVGGHQRRQVAGAGAPAPAREAQGAASDAPVNPGDLPSEAQNIAGGLLGQIAGIPNTAEGAASTVPGAATGAAGGAPNEVEGVPNQVVGTAGGVPSEVQGAAHNAPA
ncbi:hypothetical protein BDN72DRAFT_858565 [Pluteus cervinus]|uniref:Uncharacterized protein n=1 Tax=Pluteus cervinus TaxID=181527 RepID=A0ACD3ARI2_9AGAR|nr:hypothetical protein BDN72DRAFT_858565 [Pluteus cervinus]